MTDGILLAETQGDPWLNVRHDDHRRSARAQPEHRLPARLPQAVAAEAARLEADHHLGDDRCRALFAAFRRRAGDRGFRPAVSGRSALSAGRRHRKEGRRARSLRRHGRRLRRAGRVGPRRHAGLPARRARDSRGGRSAAQARAAGRGAPHRPEILPLFARLSAEEQSRIFRPPASGASCWRPTSPKRR